MKLTKDISRGESGQVTILVLTLLLLCSLTAAPLLGFMSTGIKAGQVHEKKMKEVYAADAGIEDAIHKIITDYTSIQNLDDGESHIYSLPDSVNGCPVNVTLTKLSLIQGLLSEGEYKLNQPHEEWVQFLIPPDQIVRNYSEGWVEYYCEVIFNYDGTGNRQIQSLGTFFSPFPGDPNFVEGPYDVTTTPIITFDNLQSTEIKTVPGGFAFIWRWMRNLGPKFDPQNRLGTLTFRFKVHDPDWEHSVYFVWATVKEQDISYLTNCDLEKWLIESNAGDTTIKSCVCEEIDTGALYILTWEINPPD